MVFIPLLNVVAPVTKFSSSVLHEFFLFLSSTQKEVSWLKGTARGKQGNR